MPFLDVNVTLCEGCCRDQMTLSTRSLTVMIHSPSSHLQFSHRPERFWPHLRQVISTSSGFKRWVLERGLDANATGPILDTLVQSYLRQTLETLAY